VVIETSNRALRLEVRPDAVQNEQGQPVSFVVEVKPTPPPPSLGQTAAQPVKALVIEISRADTGQPVQQLAQPLTITFRFTPEELASIGPETIVTIYASSDGGQTWQPIPAVVNRQTGEATAVVSHLTIFTLAASPVRAKVFTPFVLQRVGVPW
jgi:hypothetical protein